MDVQILYVIGSIFVLILLLSFLRKRRRRGGRSVASSESKTKEAKSWIPENAIEEKLDLLKSGSLSRNAFLNSLASSQVYTLGISSDSHSLSDLHSVDGPLRTKVVVFTSLSQLKKYAKSVQTNYPHVHFILLKKLILSTQLSFGLMVNPRGEISTEVLADEVDKIRFENR